MKLVYKKDENNIAVFFKEADSTSPFSYSEMIKKMYNEKEIDAPEIVGDFSERERKSIQEINDRLCELITK